MKISTFFLSLLMASILCADDVRLRMVDETMSPVVGATATIAFAGIARGTEKRYDGLSDAAGRFAAQGRAQHSVMIMVSKEGHYPAYFDRLKRERDWDLTVVMPRVINPIPLFALACRVGKSSRDIPSDHLPDVDETFGFDFEVGEMLPPYGHGQNADILFKIRAAFKGWKYSDAEMMKSRKHSVNADSTESEIMSFYGAFEGDVEIFFPDPSAGIVEYEKQFLAYSRLKLPHLAPTEGYGPKLNYSSATMSPRFSRKNVGYFIRTRVKRDAAGSPVSMHYVKIIGDISFDPRGIVTFTYYYNPTPNDRNLEYDTQRNLFPSTLRGALVINP